MRQMVAVHSRIGLTFTALVEITVSTITSLSVCALVGFKVTMVPWYVPLSVQYCAKFNSAQQGIITHRHRICRSRKHVQPGRRSNPHVRHNAR